MALEAQENKESEKMNCYDMLCADIDTMIDGVIDCEGCIKTDCPKDQRKYGKDTNCIDCYHFTLCDFSKNFNKRSGVRCAYFKDRSKFVELPFTVGDTVFCLSNKKIITCRVVKIIIYSKISLTFVCVTKNHTFFERNKYDIGKTVFFIKEDAEKALKERKDNG